MKKWHWALLLSSLFLLTLIVAPFLVPVQTLANTLPREQLADPDSRFLEIDGVQIHYKDSGRGEPVFILFHGFLASTFSWREVWAELSESGRAIAFDRPGFGLTERPSEWAGANPYSLEAQVAFTTGMMDALDVERAILVGHSAGSQVAILTALAYPERVRALILVDPAVNVIQNRISWIRPVLQTPQARRLGPLLVRRVQDWGLDFARSAWHDPDRITPETWEGYTKPLMAQDWDVGLWEFVLASQSLELDERLDELEMPVLVITGDDDRLVPSQESLRLAGELPNARAVVLPQCGHIPQEECPRAFLDAVTRFLEETP